MHQNWEGNLNANVKHYFGPIIVLLFRKINILMKEKGSRAETAIFIAFEDFSQLDPVQPEKTLMAAVLKSALDDYNKKGKQGRAAKEYLLSNEQEYLYSFTNVCLHLGLCPKTVRTILGLRGGFIPQHESLEARNVQSH